MQTETIGRLACWLSLIMYLASLEVHSMHIHFYQNFEINSKCPEKASVQNLGANDARSYFTQFA